ncbi:hypothetical protein DFH06DRAFT_1190821 [Mycena polygramma]|nr:hypothetical protein DFH06DRAFT_1190821 [Mycena polygramma]
MALPFELEQQIFELAAFCHPDCIPTLVRVAWRVKIWMEPLLYRVLSMYDACHGSPIRKGIRHSLLGVLSAIASRPALFQDHVRHIAVMSSLDSSDAGLAGISTVLSTSMSTTNLALFYSGSPGLLPLLAQLPLKHLSLIREHFFPLPTATDYAHSAFSQVTHLDILDWRRRSEEWDPLTGVALIPHLTHLSFHDSGVTTAVCKHALRDCKHLEVLVMLCRSPSAVSRATRAREELAADPRFVLVLVPDYVQDWENGARGAEDYWSRADGLVRRRLAGETKFTAD